MELRTGQTKQPILEIIERGLRPTRRKTHVLVVGAGIAGLVASYELRRGGHRVTLFEARSRVGGRIYTARDGLAKGLVAEVGAMRIPINHELTMAYIRRFGLKTAPFRNDNPNAYTFIRAQRRRFFEPVDDLFDVRSTERGNKIGSLLDRQLAPLTQLIVEKGDDGWAQILDRWERASLRDFLVEHGWSDGAIEMFGILSRHESLMNTSFLEFFQGSNDVTVPMIRVVGGMDRLPNSFLPEIEPDLRYGAVVRGLEQGADYVRVHYDNAAGRRSVTGDYLIVTLPYAVLRHIEVTPEFSPSKQRAIRQINYDNASKIFLQFRRRFWEDEGIHFGTTVTDLPIRNVVYPEHDHSTDRGLILASYTWSQDAHRWAALTEQERIVQALDNLARIHPLASEHFEAGFSHVWQADPFAGGAYTVFLPGQQRRLHHDISMPQGRMHFAGEHTAMHRWVEGAVESGLRAASEVVQAAQHGTTLDGGEPIDVWATLPDRFRGRRAFEVASLAIQRGDVELLRETLTSHPQIVEHRQPSTTAPYDGIYAASTLLHHAVGAPYGVVPAQANQMIEALFAAGVDSEALCGGGRLSRGVDTQWTALTLVIAHTTKTLTAATDLIESLEAGGADLDAGSGRPLHAVLTGPAETAYLNSLATYLRRRGAELDLAFAAGLGDLDAMRQWLEVESLGSSAYGRYRPEKDRIDAADTDAVLGEALVFAAQRNQPEAVQLLLDYGVSTDALAGIHGIYRSAMHAAGQGDHVEVVKLLLERGANPHVTDSEWTATPLAWAWVSSSARVIDYLRQVPQGVVINDHIYVSTVKEIRDLLAERHPDHAHAMGTPGVLLRNAAFSGRRSICAMLVELGADLSLPSALGKLPWEIARENGHLAVARQLKP